MKPWEMKPWQEIDELELDIENDFDSVVSIAIVILVVTICSAFVFGGLLLVRGLM